MNSSLFQSFFIGGFECSSHRLKSGRRLDLLVATQHDQYPAVLADYQRLQKQGIFTARESIRWHLIERKPHQYDFSSVLPMVRAARETGMQLIWDIFHYGWPDDLDIFTPAFVERFADLSAAFTKLLLDESDTTLFLAPINEISFISWAGGDADCLNPYAEGRGYELKAQLVRAAIASIEAIWDVTRAARIVQIDPVINIVAHPDKPEEVDEAEAYRTAQYQSWDMLTGRVAPELGGQEKYLDIIGVNYYAINQWFHQGRTLHRHEPQYKPFREMLAEIYERYQRPLFIGETGDEGWVRPGWLRYVGQEVRAAIQDGVPVQGLCLYPVLDYPGWNNDRHCHTGLWGFANAQGEREIYEPLARELQQQQRLFKQLAGRPKQSVGPKEKGAKAMSSTVPGKTPTICLFTDSLEPSGVGEHMLALASNLLYAYPVTLVCPPTPKGQSVLNRAAAIGCKTLALEVRGDPAAQQTLGEWLQTWDVSIFHCHAGIGWEGHQGVYAARTSGVPVVIRTEHLPYLLTDPQERQAYAEVVKQVDQVICVSQEAYNSYIAAGVPTKKLQMIRNGICIPDPQRDPVGVRAQFGLPPEAKILLTVARMTEQKGHAYLVDAMPALLAQTPEAYFVWVGEGPLEAALHQQIADKGIDPSHIIFAGWRDDVPELLAAADLFVLPSLFEGLPLVVLEAMAIGTPVVATQVCGTSEAIDDGVTGRLVPARDSAALAAAINEALTQPELAERWSVAGRKAIDQHFNAIRMVGELTTVYETLHARQQLGGKRKLESELPTIQKEWPGHERQAALQGVYQSSSQYRS